MRVVTFQSKEITNKLVEDGFVETFVNLRIGRSMNLDQPYNLGRVDDKVFIKLDNKLIILDSNTENLPYATMKEIEASSRKDRVYPFSAYAKQRYFDQMRNMSIATIYRLASHYIAYMGFDMRDIIELEIPDSEILEVKETENDTECLLLCLKKEWLVSILHFSGHVEDKAHGETALMYKNEVYDYNTYRMCYSKDIVLTGHGAGDKLEACMSPTLIEHNNDSSIQRDYVQPQVWGAFKKYCYLLRHGLPMSEIVNVGGRAATIEMPKTFDEKLIRAFNCCKEEIYKLLGIKVFKEDTAYSERIELLNKMSIF